MKRFYSSSLAHVATAVLAVALLVGPAVADVIVIDENSAGTIYDGVLDGFPGFGGPPLPQDGTADVLGNALAIALQTGVTEERGIVEFPLADLAGLVAGDIVSATLSFNIDDVLSTFGPGTTFDGTAAETIIVFGYDGNGTIELSDFENVAGSPVDVVDTTSLGMITDATLATSGPLGFDVDVTTEIQSHLTDGDAFMGIVLATNDDGSATSLDNLGDGGGGPAGVNGAFLPLLTIVTVTGDPPMFDKAQLKCQKGIGKETGKYFKTAQKEISKCADSVLAAVSKSGTAAGATAKCASAIDTNNASSKLSTAAAKAGAKIVSGCTGVTPAEINTPCDDLAGDITATASCLLGETLTSAERLIRSSYADACNILGAVSLDGNFPTICASE